MSNYRLFTSLHLAPTTFRKNKENYSLVKGATAEFSVNFDDYPYLKPAAGEPWYKYLEQMTFIFKHGDDVRNYYKLFTDRKSNWDPEVDPNEYVNDIETRDEHHWYFMVNEYKDLNYIEVDLIIDSEDSKEWELTEDTDGYAFEIVMDIDTYNESEGVILLSDSIIIEPQMPVIVVDSLYNEVGVGE